MSYKFDNIPKELKKLPQWVAWQYKHNPNNPEKQKKVPINPMTGELASVKEPNTFGTFEAAVKRFRKGRVDGIGFVFTKNDPYVGIDLDNCRNNKTGRIKLWALKIINAFESYTEVSPSGSGVHIFAKGKLPGKGKNAGNIEMYDQARYFTVTGETI